MAKTLNSICFTTLLLVVLFISAEMPKSEAKCDKYLGEVTVPHPCKERVCEAQCHEHYENACKGECEDHDDGVHVHDNHDHDHEHCYCYGNEEKCDKYLGEVTVPQPCKEHVCEAQCHEHYEHVCKGECKEHDDGVHVRDNHDHDHEHCYCYGRY